jgi:DNA-binding Lrp family transcriptional regulator
MGGSKPGWCTGIMFNDVDMRIVRALQQEGRASWTRIAELADVPGSTAYRRGTTLIEAGHLRIAVVPAQDRLQNSRIYELLLRCRPRTQRAVAARLAARQDTRWVAVISGEFGVAADLIIPQGADVATLLLDDIESDPDIIVCQATLVLRSLTVDLDWQTPPGRAAPSPGSGDPATHQCDESHLHEDDRAILALLRDDGRRSYASIAAELGMNETTVRRRCTDMLRLGCAEVITLVQPHLLGFEQEVQIHLDVLPQQMEPAIQMLAKQPGVHYVASTFGAMSLTCEIKLRSHHDLYGFLRDVVAQVPGVTKMTAEIELIVFKRAFVLCPWASVEPARPVIAGQAGEPA